MLFEFINNVFRRDSFVLLVPNELAFRFLLIIGVVCLFFIGWPLNY